ncbi:Fic/DOC family protein [Listeria booriae]|uniref:Fic/DOC family protein n=1 Tax=Listeria booriae TaxID=1552123 RepID=UPI0016265F38|nr:Fic family protein [Listeria booriae]MBC2305122.1 hypothetical protein [Listeria booriae]
MYNSPEDKKYYDSDNGILRNKLGILNQQQLDFIEHQVVSDKLLSLKNKEIKSERYANHLLDIHRILFQDIYEWAGELRNVEMTKGATNFLPSYSLPNAFIDFDSQLRVIYKKRSSASNEWLNLLAKLSLDINFAHPFREGNGRAGREFIRQVASLLGYDLNIGRSHELYMQACIEDDIKLMGQVIEKEIRRMD